MYSFPSIIFLFYFRINDRTVHITLVFHLGSPTARISNLALGATSDCHCPLLKNLQLPKDLYTRMSVEVDYTHQWDTYPVELDGKNLTFIKNKVLSQNLRFTATAKL